VIRLVARLRAALERHLFGLTADEIRYTFEDVRQELRATRAELMDELAVIRRDLDRLAASSPLPALRGEEEEGRLEREQGEGA
jgi:hypothetical protein